MSKVPSAKFDRIVAALQRDGWIVVRQKGSHIRLHKRLPSETLKVTVPAHNASQALDFIAYFETGAPHY